MVDDVSDRIDDTMPADLTDRDEIADALGDSGWSQSWDQATLDSVVDNVSARRDPTLPEVMRAKREQTDILGPQDNRQSMVRAADGTAFGDPGNVTTWEDRWGNVMGYNENTGERRKIQDSEEVGQ